MQGEKNKESIQILQNIKVKNSARFKKLKKISESVQKSIASSIDLRRRKKR